MLRDTFRFSILIRNCRIQRVFLLLIQEPTVNRTPITDHEPSYTWWPLNKQTDHEPSYLMTAQPTVPSLITSHPTWWPLHWSRAFQCTSNTWWQLNLSSNGHHYRSAIILTTYTYKNTFIIIINNNNYFIIQPKTRLHTPFRAITSLLTAGAPSKPSHSRSTIQAFSQQEHSAFSQHEDQSLLTAGALSFLTAWAPSLLTVEGPSLNIEGAQPCQVFLIISGPVTIRGC